MRYEIQKMKAIKRSFMCTGTLAEYLGSRNATSLLFTVPSARACVAAHLVDTQRANVLYSFYNLTYYILRFIL